MIEGELKTEEAKVRINMFIDGDLLIKIREEAKNRNTKYQTLINQSLREFFLNEQNIVNVDEFKELKHRVELLEALLKKQA